MYFLISVFVFAVGMVVGSFLNVVILRHGTDHSSVSGRSMCPQCGKTLTWVELIPLISFCMQRGVCRSCRAPISWQYPIVESITGVLFLASYWHFKSGLFDSIHILYTLFYFIVVSLLVVIAVYDFHHKIIPNTFVYSLIGISGIQLFITPSSFSFSTPTLWNILAGPLLYVPFALLWLGSGIRWQQLSFSWEQVGRWMGFGDAKLAWAIGWLLGVRIGLSSVILSFWIGAVYSIGLLLFQRMRHRGASDTERITMKTEVPFGPFLVLGTLIGMFLPIDILSLNYFLIGF